MYVVHDYGIHNNFFVGNSVIVIVCMVGWVISFCYSPSAVHILTVASDEEVYFAIHSMQLFIWVPALKSDQSAWTLPLGHHFYSAFSISP